MFSTSMDEMKILRVSEMAENLTGSEIIRLAGEINEKIRSGNKILNYTIGDFDPDIFPAPEALINEIINAYKDGQTNYPPSKGLLNLRQSVSRFLLTHGGLEYNENQILIAGGSRPLIYASYQTIVDEGDTVVFPVPSWNNNHYCHLSHAKQVMVRTSAENNFMPTAADIKPYLSNAVLVALCSPNNPTGTVFDEGQLEEICDVILEENHKRNDMQKPVYLLYDQVYWKLTHGNSLHFDPVTLRPEMKNYTIFIDGISKAFASTGVRVGWAFGPQKVMEKMQSILGHMGAWAPRAEQVACAKFLERDDLVEDYLFSIKNKLYERLLTFYNGFIKLKEFELPVDAISPQAAMYLTVRFDLIGKETQDGEKLKSGEDISRYLLREARIGLVPFSAFGAKSSDWFRLSVGTVKMEEIDVFFDKLKKAIEKLV